MATACPSPNELEKLLGCVSGHEGKFRISALAQMWEPMSTHIGGHVCWAWRRNFEWMGGPVATCRAGE